MNPHVKYILLLVSEAATPGQHCPGDPADICKSSTAEWRPRSLGEGKVNIVTVWDVCWPVRCVQTGWAPGPVTSTLSISVNLTPCCLKATCLISSIVPGSCPPNWLHGKAGNNLSWIFQPIKYIVTSCLVSRAYCYNWGRHGVSWAPCNETLWTRTRWQHSPPTPPCRRTGRREPEKYKIYSGNSQQWSRVYLVSEVVICWKIKEIVSSLWYHCFD